MMDAPPPAPSSLSLPVSVSLPGLAAAADARVPRELATFEQDQPLAGGALGTVHLSGVVTRAGAVRVQPEAGGLRVTLPVAASVRATGGVLNKTFTGSADVLLHLKPSLNQNWTASVAVQADYSWTDPMNLEILGAQVSLTPLIDPLVRGQLDRLGGAVQDAFARATNLRPRAETLWARLSQPWPLPTPEPSYLAVQPLSLSVTPIQVSPQALSFTLQASFAARGGLGTLPTATPLAPPLPPLRQSNASPPGLHLALPLRLDFRQLSDLATRAAAGRDFRLPVLLNPSLHLDRVVVTGLVGNGRAGQLNAECHVTLRALGLSVQAVVDVSGTPVLEGSLLRLAGARVHTRDGGLTSRVLGWLADRRAQDFVAGSARFDTAPELARALASVRARLPWRLAPGVTLAGTVSALKLSGLTVDAAGVVLDAQAAGDLRLDLQAEALQ